MQKTVTWRSVHPQTDHATFRPKLSVHPTNHLLWQFTTVTIVHLYDPSMYFLSTPPSRWTVCHLWHNVHPPQNALWHHVHPFLKQNLDGLSQHFGTHLWPPAGFSAKCGHFFALFLDICDVPPACSANCGRFVTGSTKKARNLMRQSLSGSVVTRESEQKKANFREKWTFCHVWTKCHSKVGRKIRRQNVTDFWTKYYSETVCHTVTNHPNLLGWNVTILGGWTIRPPWDGMSQ